MATFAGKQVGYADPTMRHESPGITTGTAPSFAGVQAGQAAPTVKLWLVPLDKVEA